MLYQPLTGGLVADPHEVQPAGGLVRRFCHERRQDSGETGISAIILMSPPERCNRRSVSQPPSLLLDALGRVLYSPDRTAIISGANGLVGHVLRAVNVIVVAAGRGPQVLAVREVEHVPRAADGLVVNVLALVAVRGPQVLVARETGNSLLGASSVVDWSGRVPD
jgi:hypothetical protein